MIDDTMASRTALAPCPARAGPFLTGGPPYIAFEELCSRFDSSLKRLAPH